MYKQTKRRTLVVPFVVVHVRCQVARVLLQVVPFVVGHVHYKDEHTERKREREKERKRERQKKATKLIW
jgi:hypothetical protein